MATEIQVPNPDVFQIIDSYDEKQILELKDFRDNKALTYEVKGKKEISYLGIKHLSLIMAINQNPLEIEDSKVELIGEAKEKTWYAKVKIKNRKTGQITEGLSECPFYTMDKDDSLIPDNFARVKAHSKAERNAIRKHIPEGMITKLINEVQNPTAKKSTGFNNNSDTKNLCACVVPQPNPTDNNHCTSCRKNIRN